MVVGVGVGVGVVCIGISFSPAMLTLLCLRLETASLKRPWRALGSRDEDFAALFASMRARLVAASREGGLEGVRAEMGLLACCCRLANEVVLRVNWGGFDRLDEGGRTEGSSARSHIAADDCERETACLPLPSPVGVFICGSINVLLRELGVGGVRPIPEPTRVDPVLEPEPSRRPADDAGRRRFMFMFTAEARLILRLPFAPLLMPDCSTWSQALTSSSAICRTKTAESCSMSQLMRS